MTSTDRLAADEAPDHETQVRQGFWEKARSTLGKVPFTEDAVAAFYCATDSATPLPIRATLFGALAYFILPFDLVTDFLPLLGFGDDAAVLYAAIRTVMPHIKPEHRVRAKEALDKTLQSSVS
jgi:uncharacterized membrane protein YkvA (DUF1232 family)